MEKNNIFSCIVVSSSISDADKLMKKYDSNLTVKPFIKYKFKDASKIKEEEQKILNKLINENIDVDKNKPRLDFIQSLSSFDYYKNLVAGYEIDDYGNALSTENLKGQYSYCNIGKNFSQPFILTNGTQVYQAPYSEIDWSKMHMEPSNVNMYKSVWDMVINGKKPENDIEQTLYDNMSIWKNYFSNFNNVDEYVAHNCSFWHYAYCDKNGWIDIDTKNSDSKKWIFEFYDRFIVPLNNDDILTIYECKR